ncbi:unnamed protein product [Absidia cylindrospora]
MLCSFFLATVLLTLFSTSFAFCFGNVFDGETSLSVVQMDNYGGAFLEKFSATISPGEQSCCNFGNNQCNKQGTPEALTTFTIYTNIGEDTVATGLQKIHLPSGGYSNIGGAPHQPTIDRFDDKGQPFAYDEPHVKGMVDY